MFSLNTSARIDRQQQEVRAGGIGGPAVKRRVQLVQLLIADAGDLGGELQVDLARRVDAREEGWFGIGLKARP